MWLILALAAVGAFVWYRQQSSSGASLDPFLAVPFDSELDGLGDFLDFDFYDHNMHNEIDLSHPNLQAFLTVIRHAEGTLAAGDKGYGMMFGGLITNDLSDHPRQVHCHMLGGKEICSSAAGAYQFLTKTWDWIANDLPDFGKQSQDLAAARLIKYRGGLQDIYAGRFDEAVNLVRKEWASLPGAGYGQPEKNLAELRTVFLNAGGYA